jgi:chromate transporter
MSTPAPTPLSELLWLFLKLGATAFGGPAAHIAMMQEEVVRRRAWLTDEEFLDLLGAVNLLPGPNSTELAIHIGLTRGGPAGLLVAGVAFILPAMLITGAFGWAYVTYGALPQVGWLLYGVKPVMIAIILHALRALAPKAARTNPLRLIAAAALVAALLGAHELLVLASAGLLAMIAASVKPAASDVTSPLIAPALLAIPAATAASAATPTTLLWVFAKIGSVLFGSGYVLLAFLRAELVDRLGWLTEPQLIDAVAVGQVTPGPVFTTATFIGYLLAGPSGALAATIGIFLPAFFFVAVSGPLVRKLRASPAASALLDGVNAASLALMAAVSLQLAAAALIDLPTLLIAAASLPALTRHKLNPTWLLAAGALTGVLVQLVRS